MPASQLRQSLLELDSTKIFFTDLHGRPMGLPINPENIQEIIEGGIGFDGSSIAGIADVDDSDRIVRAVSDSFRLVEFEHERLGFFVGQIFYRTGKRSTHDPRAVLERVLAEAESEFGFRFMVGPEHEFFLLNGDEINPTLHPDKEGYFSDDPGGAAEVVRHDIIEVLKRCGIKFEKAHHEVTPSQHEINLECGEPMSVADRCILFHHVTKKVARKHGMLATFMPKPFDGYNRNAFHVHISMQDAQGENLFHGKDDAHGLSELGSQFVGGILKYARETSLVMASTYNSYKAYIMEKEAPVIRGWGVKNRSSMVRLPYALRPSATRLELRSPDPAGNVYLQFAVLIAMGLQGIREKLDPGAPDAGSTYRKEHGWQISDENYLPRCMFEALVEAQRSTFLQDVLGEGVFRGLLDIKIADWEGHRTHVTAREHEKYLAR